MFVFVFAFVFVFVCISVCVCVCFLFVSVSVSVWFRLTCPHMRAAAACVGYAAVRLVRFVVFNFGFVRFV